MLLLDEPLSGVDGGQRGADRGACSPSCATRAARCSSRRTTSRQAARWDRVLCLHGRQIAFGAAGRDADARSAARDLWRGADRARRRRRARSASATTRTDARLADRPVRRRRSCSARSPSCSSSRSPAGRSASGSCSTATPTRPSRSATGCCPGWCVAALAGAPLLLGAAGGVLLAAAGIALVARDERARRATSASPSACPRCSGSAGCSRSRPPSPPRLQELLFGDLLGVGAADLSPPARFRRRRGRAGGRSPLARARGVRPRLGAVARRAAARAGSWRCWRCSASPQSRRSRASGTCCCSPCCWLPAAAALRLARRLGAALALAAGLAALAGIAGLIVSYHLQIATGASVALCAVAIALPAGGSARWPIDPLTERSRLRDHRRSDGGRIPDPPCARVS